MPNTLRPADPFPGYDPDEPDWEDLPDFPETPSVDQMGLWDTEPHNWVDHAARRGAGVVKEYAERCDNSDVGTVVADLLSDLRHFCDAARLDFHEVCDKSYRTYLGDRNP